MTQKTLVLSTVAALFLGGCSFSPRNISVEVKWDSTRARQAAPERVTDVSCFFVNVSAADILVNYGPESFGGRSPSCLNLGVIAGPYSLSELTAGVKIKVQPGSQRTIEILGAISAPLGSLCHNFSLPDYFNTASPPQLFSLGSTTTKIYVDSAVTVNSTYSAASARDRVAACSGNNSGSGIVAEGNITGALAVAAFSLTPELRTYDYSAEAGTFTFAESFSDPNPAPLGTYFSDDFTRLAVPYNGAALSKISLYSVDRQRHLTQISPFPFSAGALESWTTFAVAPGAAAFYGFSTNSAFTFEHVGTTTTEHSAFFGGPFIAPVATPGALFAFVPARSGLILTRYQRAADGTLSSPVSYMGIVGNVGEVALAFDRSYTRLFVVHPPYISYYEVSGTTLSLLQSYQDKASGVPYRLAVNRAGTRLYLATGTTTLTISYYEVTPESLYTTLKSSTVLHTGRIILEPSGKRLYLDNTPLNLTEILLDESAPTSLGTQSSISLLGAEPISLITPKTLSFAPRFE